MKSIKFALAMATASAHELFLEKAQDAKLVFGPQESFSSEFMKNVIIAAKSTGSDIVPCQYWVGSQKAKWYNLKPLEKPTGDFYDVNGHDDEQVLFNLCGAFNPQKVHPECKDSDRYAYLIKKDGTCDSITASEDADNEVTFKEMQVDNDPDGKTTGVQLTFQGSDDQCDNGKYGLKVFITCNKEMKSGEVKDLKFARTTPNTCVQELTMTAKDGCPALDINEIFVFFSQYAAFYGAVMIIIGLFINFLGRKSIKPTVFLISFVACTFCLLLILYSLFMQHEREMWVNWLVLGLCTVAGLIFGIFMAYSLKYGLALLSGSAGALLAFTLCNTFQLTQKPAIFWSIVVVFALLCIVITYKKSDQFMIFTTAMIGSYLFVRGISLYAGGFPNEFTIAEQIKSGALEHIPYWFYVYLGGIVISMGVGIWYQSKEWKLEGPGYKHPYHHL